MDNIATHPKTNYQKSDQPITKSQKKHPQIYNSMLDPTWSLQLEVTTKKKNTRKKNLWVFWGSPYLFLWKVIPLPSTQKKRASLKSSNHPKRRPNYQPIRSPSAVATKALISFQLPRPPTWLIHRPKSDPSSKTSRNSFDVPFSLRFRCVRFEVVEVGPNRGVWVVGWLDVAA